MCVCMSITYLIVCLKKCSRMRSKQYIEKEEETTCEADEEINCCSTEIKI